MSRPEEPGWISILDMMKLEERLCGLRALIAVLGLIAGIIIWSQGGIGQRGMLIIVALFVVLLASTLAMWAAARRKLIRPAWQYVENTIDVSVITGVLAAVLHDPSPNASLFGGVVTGYVVAIFGSSVRFHAASTVYTTVLSVVMWLALTGHAVLSGTTARSASLAIAVHPAVIGLWPALMAITGVVAVSAILRGKHVVSALQEADRRQARAMQLVHDGLVLCDSDQRVLEVNAGAIDLLGLPRTNLVGLHATASMPADVATILQDNWETILAGGTWATQGVKVAVPGGEELWLDIAAQRLVHQGQQMVQLALHDATAEHKMQGDSAQAGRFQALRALTTGVAHEFNNIFATIEASSFILSEAVSKTAPEYTEVEAIRAAAARAARFASELLDMADMRAPAPKPIDTCALIRKAAQTSRPPGSKVQDVIDLPDRLPKVRGDEGQIERALGNLIAHGHLAMLDGGDLTISAREVVIRRGDDRAPPGRYVEITTRDTGIGMPAHVAERAFDLLSQPDINTDATGAVRLANARATVERHGGSIRLKSSVGQGTAFEVLLPAAPDADAMLPSEPSQESGAKVTRRLLVVDDEPANRTSLARLLSFRGYDVLLAEDGMTAIRIAEEQGDQIDLVLLDLLMPEMNGKDVLTALRSRCPSLKVLLVTGYAEQVLVQEALDLGAVGVTYKPFDVPALLEQVQHLTQG